MKTKSPLVAGMAIGLLAVMPAVATAQGEGSASREPAYFTAAMGMAEGFPEPFEAPIDDSVSPGGGYDAVDAVFSGISLESSDPRMTGVMSMAISSAQRSVDDAGFVQAERYLYHVENDEGTWTGPGTGFIAIADDGPKGEQVGSLVGHGAYDGLYAVVTVNFTDAGEELEGIIYAGELPPSSDFDGSLEGRAALE